MAGAIRSKTTLALRTDSKWRFTKVVALLLLVVSAAGRHVSARIPAQALQNVSGGSYRGILEPGAEDGLRKNRDTVRSALPADYRAVHTSFSQEDPPAKRIQEALDKLCASFFSDLCALGVKSFCHGDAVARFGAGSAEAKKEAWRCYAQKTLENSGAKLQCVDDCGVKLPCEGSVKSDSLFLTLEQGLQEMSTKIATRTCPQRQRAANEYCASFGSDHVARFSATPKSSSASWRCFKTSTLLFSSPSECGGHCKEKLIPCPGGIPPNAGEEVIYYTRHSELQTALAGAPDPCPGKQCLEKSTGAVCT